MATKKKPEITVINTCQVSAVTSVDEWSADGMNAAYAKAVKSLEKAAAAALAKILVSGRTVVAVTLSDFSHQLINEEIYLDGVRGTATLLSSATWASQPN